MSWVFGGVPAGVLTVLGASIGAAVVLLYVLKLRRRRIAVPYATLWRRLVEERRPSRVWERLKWIVGLLLHLAVLVLLLLALGDPRAEQALRESRSVVLVVDTSASMSATDEAGHRTRIDRARDEARAVVDALGPRDEVMLVAVDGRLRPLTPFSNDLGLVDEAIATLTASATSADMADALRFAVAALAGRPRSTIVLVSDGAFPAGWDAEPGVAPPTGIDVVHRPVGRHGGNVGVTAFNVRRYPSNRTNYEVYARVENFADAPVTVELSILGEGRLVHTETLDLGAGAHAIRIYPDIPAAGRHLEARIRVAAGDVVDALAMDDVAHALLPDRRPLRVLLVTEGNLYLEAPFLLNESLDVDTIRPEAYEAANAGDPSAGYDVTVFDRVAPPVAESGNFLYFAPSGSHSPWRVDSDVVAPIIHSTERGHPLLNWISGLRDVNIARARSLGLTPADRVIASAIGGAPMIVARETPIRRQVGVAFDVADTDFPLRVAWPVFLLNTLDWFTRDSSSLVEAYRTGDTWLVPIGDRTATSVAVTAPSGRRFDAVARDGVAVFYGDEIGTWDIAVGDRSVTIAGNLADADESRIGPAAELAVAGGPAATVFEDHGDDAPFEPWMVLIAIAFAVVLAEWITWNRRVTV